MSTASDGPCFVWLKGVKGNHVRQKWAMRSRLPGGGTDHYWEEKIISAHPITQEQFDTLTLDQLAALFPLRRTA